MNNSNILTAAILLFGLIYFAWTTYLKITVVSRRLIADKVKAKTAQLFLYIMQGCKRIYLRLNVSPKVDTDTGFLDLTPTTDADQDGVYANAINYGLVKPNIRNIALTGTYGSGKSSILKAFQYKNPQYKYLNISLASFQNFLKPADDNEDQLDTTSGKDSAIPMPNDKKGKEASSPNSDAETIEYSILQQIFYHVKHKHIPYSRFKRIKNLPTKVLLPRAILLLIWIVGLIYAIKKEWTPLPHMLNAFISDHRLIRLVGFGYLTLGAIVILYSLMRIYNNSKFNRLNLSSGEMEISPDKETSILNRHLEEIIYFFEVTHFDVMIIEDLDRFRNPEIFTKLREINTLINNSMQVNRKVTFIYALKDDIFLDESRTKFFDHIIPVIPITNAGNSEASLTNVIDKMKLNNPIPSDFISYLSFYITDMRLLNNIINEFKIYKNLIKDFEVDNATLMGMIVYKNKFPTDYSNLHHNKGIVYDIFANKHAYRADLSESLQKEKEKLSEQLAITEHNYLKSISELRMLYVAQLLITFEEKYSPYDVPEVYINNKIKQRDLTSEFYFRQLKTQTQIIFANRSGNLTYSKISFSEIEKEVNSTLTYDQRESALNQAQGYDVQKIKADLHDVNQRIAKIENYDMRQLMLQKPSLFQNSKIASQEFEILAYMIREGYLNENYQYYMSYFFEGTITQKDLTFYFSIKHKRPLEQNYKLDKIPHLFKKLSVNDFTYPEALNFDLVNYLIKNRALAPKQTGALFGQFTTLSPSTVKFIDAFIENTDDKATFLTILCDYCPKFWEFISNEPMFGNDRKEFYLVLMLTSVENDRLLEMDTDCKLRDYISNKHQFLQFSTQLPLEKLIALLNKMDVQFLSLAPPQNESEKMVLDCIYRNNLYQINQQMVELMIVQFGSDITAGMPASYTTILHSGANHLIQYLNDHLEIYLNNAYIPATIEPYKESEKIMATLINNKEISEQTKRTLIGKADFTISNLEDIQQVEYWDQILTDHKVNFSWKNITTYTTDERKEQHPHLSEVLFAYLNDNGIYNQILSNTSKADLEDNNLILLVSQIIYSGKLSDGALDAILNTFPKWNFETHFKFLSKSLTTKLIETHNIPDTKAAMLELNLHHPDLMPLYLETYQMSLFRRINGVKFSPRQVIDVLYNGIITIANKQELINKLSIDEIVDDNDLLTAVKAFFLKYKQSLDFAMLQAILSKGQDNEHTNAELMANSMGNIEPSQVRELLLLLQGVYADITLPEPFTVSSKGICLPLVKKLAERGFITFEQDGVKKGQIRITPIIQ